MKHLIACAAVILFVSGPCAIAHDPPCVNIPTFLCSNMPHLTGNETWIPTSYHWTPNRLPAAIIHFRTGNYCYQGAGNYRGLQGWWYDNDDGVYDDEDGLDPFCELHDRLDDAYIAGYRRIILNLPAGTVGGGQDFSGSQWWGMPESKRNRLNCVITNWISENPDTQFEVYMGYPINDPESLCMEWNQYSDYTIAGSCTSEHGNMYYPCAEAGNAYPPSPFVQSDVCNFHLNIQPWQYLGVTRIWLDGSHAFWSSDFPEFPYCSLYAPGTGQQHFLGMEAFPMDFTDPAHPEIDLSHAIHCPAIMGAAHIALKDADKSWDVSAYADVTELMVMVNHAHPYFSSLDMFGVLAWTQRGFVLAVQPTDNALLPSQLNEYMKRVYDFGVLSNRRDFNGDGNADGQDVTDFSTAYGLYAGKTNCNWVHGDMDQDHDVDSHDYLLFYLWHNTIGGSMVSVNLGIANPDYALTKP